MQFWKPLLSIFTRFQFAAALVASLLAQSAAGQLPTAELKTVFPPGGKAGTEFDVALSGASLDGDQELRFNHPGITAQQKTRADEFLGELPVADQFQVKIAADVPPGIYEATCVGRFGVSNPRGFVVGSWDEAADSGNNGALETAQEIVVGQTINGRADANKVDYYKVALKTGQRILIDVCAWQLDSRMDPVLKVMSATGEDLALDHDYEGRDAALDFTAPADGDYLIGLYDLLYGGGVEHPYRLTVHAGAQIDFVFPPSGPVGSTNTYTIYGRNLPGGKPTEVVAADGVKLEALSVPIEVSKDSESGHVAGKYTGLESQELATILHHQPQVGDVVLGVARAPQVTLEQEPNNDSAKATKVTAPTEVAGQFYPAGDVDYYQFDAKKGDVFWIEVISHRAGLPTDPHLLIQRVDMKDGAEQVKDVAYLDDPADRNGRVGGDFDTSTDDPSYRLAVPDDGVYRIMVGDLFGDGRSDPRMTYRLCIRTEQPDFRLLAEVKQQKVANANQVLVYSPVIRQGGTIPLELSLQRIDGFAGEVEVNVEGLPPGVECRGAMMAGPLNTTTLILQASEDAAPWNGLVKIVAKAKIGDREVQRFASFGTVIWGTANRTQDSAEFRITRGLRLSVIPEKSPGLIEAGDNTVLETSLGGSLDVPLKLTRRNASLDADVKLTALNVTNELKPADVTIKKGAADGKLEIKVTNAKAQPGSYTLVLRADSKVKYEAFPEQVAVLEERQKKLDEIVKQLAEAVKQQTAAQAAAAKAMTDSAAALKAAEAAQQQAVAEATKAAEAVEAAKKAVAAKPEDEAAKKAVADAEAAATTATQKSEAAAKAAAEAAAAAQAAAEAKTKADADLKESQDKSKRATDAKTAADKAVADTKKAVAAKDVDIALFSTPIKVRIVETPISLSAPEKVDLAADQKVMVLVKLEKKYAFDEPVDVTLTLPKGVAGVTVGKLKIEKGMSEGQVELSANAAPTAGDHVVAIEAKGQFNKVNVAATGSLTLHIPAVEAAKK